LEKTQTNTRHKQLVHKDNKYTKYSSTYKTKTQIAKTQQRQQIHKIQLYIQNQNTNSQDTNRGGVAAIKTEPN
jgi:hypothetical protein